MTLTSLMSLTTTTTSK